MSIEMPARARPHWPTVPTRANPRISARISRIAQPLQRRQLVPKVRDEAVEPLLCLIEPELAVVRRVGDQSDDTAATLALEGALVDRQ